MQVSTVAVAAVSFLACITLPAAQAEICNTTELTEALQPVLANANYSTCVADVGTSLPFTSAPTGKEIAAMCDSSACKSLITIAETLDLPDCEVVVNGTAYSVLQVRARRVSQCSSTSYTSSIIASVSLSEAESEHGSVSGSGSKSELVLGPESETTSGATTADYRSGEAC